MSCRKQPTVGGGQSKEVGLPQIQTEDGQEIYYKDWGRVPAGVLYRAVSETDFTEDLKRFNIPTLILHGDDDQIVPIAGSASKSVALVLNAQLLVYPGAPHGLAAIQAAQPNADLLAFFAQLGPAGGAVAPSAAGAA